MPTTSGIVVLLPTPSVTLGPEWATELNAALETICNHNHTTNQGVLIPSAALNLNGDISLQENYINYVGAVRLVNQGSPLGTADDNNTIYASGGNFWFNSGSGQQVQITSGASLNASSLGAIGGDYGSSTALLAYYNINQTFVFTQDTNQAAPIDCGQVSIRDTAVLANKITLKSPVALAASYDITLPAALPSSTGFLQLSSAGLITTGPTPPGTNSAVVTIDSTGAVNKAFTVIGSNLSGITNLDVTGILTGPSLVPVGAIIPFYDFNGLATFNNSYWVYCNGGTISNPSSILNGQTLPDLSGRYIVGFGTDGGGDIGTATWATAAVGNAGNTINIAHTHLGGSHTHSAGSLYARIGAEGGGTNRIALKSYASGSYYTNIRWATGGIGMDSTASSASYAVEVNGTSASGGVVTSGSSLSSSQSIQPRSIRVRYIMRIL